MFVDFVTFSVFLAQILSTTATAVRPLSNRAESGVLTALLRRPTSGSNLPYSGPAAKRQGGTCDIGFLPCADGQGCCAVGEYCGTFGGSLGCCPNGETCSSNSSQCKTQGYLPCSGDTFCCPAGDFCGRDSSGQPQCYTSSGGNGGGGSSGNGGGGSSGNGGGGSSGNGGGGSSGNGGGSSGSGGGSGGNGGGGAPTTANQLTTTPPGVPVPSFTDTSADTLTNLFSTSSPKSTFSAAAQSTGGTSPLSGGSSGNGVIHTTVGAASMLIAIVVPVLNAVIL